jgi:hypothetical protein
VPFPALTAALRAVRELLMPTPAPRGPWFILDGVNSPERYAAESSLLIHDDDA